MIVIKSIEYAGGACPYQIEATTEDGKYFYLRYRGGRLRACVLETRESFFQSGFNYNVIDIPFGMKWRVMHIMMIFIHYWNL